MRRLLLTVALSVLSAGAFADNNVTIQGLKQTDFSNLSQDLGAVTSYKQLQGASSEGITGFDVGLNLGNTKLANTDVTNGTTNNTITSLPFWDLTISKGLPFGFDIGGMYSAVPNSNIKLYGVEGRYAILDGGIAEPAIGVRAAYTHLTGVDNLSFNTKTLDVSISKGFGPITPYAGVGEVWTSSTPDASTGLQGVSFSNGELFAGITFELGIHMSLEYDRLAGNTTYTLKLGFGF